MNATGDERVAVYHLHRMRRGVALAIFFGTTLTCSSCSSPQDNFSGKWASAPQDVSLDLSKDGSATLTAQQITTGRWHVNTDQSAVISLGTSLSPLVFIAHRDGMYLMVSTGTDRQQCFYPVGDGDTISSEKIDGDTVVTSTWSRGQLVGTSTVTPNAVGKLIAGSPAASSCDNVVGTKSPAIGSS
jgi:hypothetical protein